MAAIFTDLATVERAIEAWPHEVAVAAVNGPASIVISGKRERIAMLVDAFAAQDIRSVPLNTSHAFHSPLLEPMLDRFQAAAKAVAVARPAIPFYSNLTGAVMDDAPTDLYWRRHCREPVQFARSVERLAEAGFNVLVEIGPKPVLVSLARVLCAGRRDPVPCPAAAASRAASADRNAVEPVCPRRRCRLADRNTRTRTHRIAVLSLPTQPSGSRKRTRP